MLRIFASMLAALPLAAVAQARHEHHPQPAVVAKPAEKAPPVAVQPSARGAGTSAFARYQRFTPDEPLKGWRQVNDTVRDIGGWQVYGLEAARAIEAEKKAKGGQP